MANVNLLVKFCLIDFITSILILIILISNIYSLMLVTINLLIKKIKYNLIKVKIVGIGLA